MSDTRTGIGSDGAAVADIARDLVRRSLLDGDPVRAQHAAQILFDAGATLDDLYTGVLQPLMDDVGRRWAAGELSVAQEHVASASALQLISCLQAVRQPGARNRGRVALVGAAGERHLIGLAMLEHALRERGWETVMAGELPVPEIVTLVEVQPPLSALALSFHDAQHESRVAAALAQLRRVLPDLPVVVGGLALRNDPAMAARLGAPGGTAGVAEAVALVEAQANVLTERECAIVALVSHGSSNAEIAAELGVTASTVKTHLERIFAKLGARDRASAVATALRRGYFS